MVLSIKITPLYGSLSEGTATCTLLSLDGLNILLDCGWNAAFDPAFLSNLASVAPSVNVVLLSHPDLAHLGALPYAVSKLGLSAAIFSTLPVWRMGQMFMYDAFLSHDAQRPFTIFNLDDVDAAFEYSPDQEKTSRFTLLKYQQQYSLDGIDNGKGVFVTPHPAGHMLGGAVWNIVKGTESIVYAVHTNHKKERHLNPATLANFSRPSHLIVSATNAPTRTQESRSTAELIDVITATVNRRGNVLIPVDTAGRIIELAVVLHTAWERLERLHDVPLVILHPLSVRTFDFARSMIEWMSDEVVKRFDVSRDNLFVFKHIKLCQELSELDALQQPMVVLASSATMEIGFSRELFERWCKDSRNAVVLVDRSEPDTLYSKLYERSERPDKKSALKMKMMMRRKESLQGEELEQWREQERARKRLEKEKKRKEEEERAAVEALEKESEAEAFKAALAEEEAGKNQMEVEAHVEEVSPVAYEEEVLAYLIAVGAVQSKPSEQFKYEPPPRDEWDDYGQKVDATRFIIGEDPGEGGPQQSSEIPNGTKQGAEPEEEEEIPSKYVEQEVEVTVACDLVISDHSGLSDGDSLKRLLREVEPRHVTVIAGTVKESEDLVEFLRKSVLNISGSRGPGAETGISDGGGSLVVLPREMETVDVSVDMSVCQFALDDTLVKGVEWDEVGFSRIRFVDAIVKPEVDEHAMQVIGGVNVEDISNSVQAMAYEMSGDGIGGHGTYFIGTIMLNKLKDKLQQAGMKAEFAGGALCVENAKTGVVVVLKKVGNQHIVLDGAFSEEYLLVRDVLYNELVIPR